MLEERSNTPGSKLDPTSVPWPLRVVLYPILFVMVAFVESMKWLGHRLLDGLETLIHWIWLVLDPFWRALIRVLRWCYNALRQVLSRVWQWINYVWDGLVVVLRWIGRGLRWIGRVFWRLIRPIWLLLRQVLLWIDQILTRLFNALAALYHWLFDPVYRAWITLWRFILRWMKRCWHQLRRVSRWIGRWLIVLWRPVQRFFMWCMHVMTRMFKTVTRVLKWLFHPLYVLLVWFGSVWRYLWSRMIRVLSWLWRPIGRLIEQITIWLHRVIRRVQDDIRRALRHIRSWFQK
jgi:hypothetical protein